MYEALADALVVVHLAYVGFVVFGELLILIGYLLKWPWISNPWFRWGHLLAIDVVVCEAIFGITCPLTVWERQLRAAAGRPQPDETFIGGIVHQVLFFELPPWVFTTIYVTFGLVVFLTLLLVPPRGFRRAPATGEALPPG